MSSTEVILVGVDGSTESLAAVKWAADRGARTGARIHCLCTYALASYSAAALDGGYAVLDDEALKAGAEQVVEEAKALARERGATHVSGSTEPGDPAGVLIDFSAEVDMIVVGSRGGGGFADRLLGTVSSALPAHSKCPVVVVPRHTSGKKFTPVERIVVGIDGSNDERDAVKAGTLQATVMLQAQAIAAQGVTDLDNYLQKGEKPAKQRVMFRGILITQDNADKVQDFNIKS